MTSLFLLSSWEQFPAIAWVAPSFVFSHNMSQSDNGQTVAVAATSQVKLCPYDEEELAIWFRLIEAQFATAASNHKNSGTAMLWLIYPSQVLRDILNTVDVCNELDQPFDLLKEVLLGQFGKSKG